MKQINYLVAVIAVLLAQPVNANTQSDDFGYKIKCENGKILFIDGASKKTESENCRSFLEQGYGKCFDTKKKYSDYKKIVISVPIDHYYKSKQSESYSREAMEQVVDLAVKSGSDPYLALAIVMMESPPLLNDPNAKAYAFYYGRPPVDAMAVADYFGCKSTYDKENGTIRFINLKKQQIPNGEGVSKNICLNDSFPGGYPQFYYTANPDISYCCKTFQIDHKFDADRVIPSIYSSQIVSNASAYYMKTRFEYAFSSKTSGQMSPEKRMATIAQAYNGYGKFGVTEKMKNNCLYKMNFSETPLYGAGASDLMLNSLMANSEVIQMVAASLRSNKAGAAPKSYLCSSYGDGEHKVSAYLFSNQIKTYLEKRKHCPQQSYRIRSDKSETILTRTSSSKGSDPKKSKVAQ